QRADQSRWRKDLPARNRRSAARASCRGRGGLLRRAAWNLGGRGRRRGGPPRRGHGSRAPGVLPRAPGRLQAAEADSHRGGDPSHGDRQDSARRRGEGLQAESLVRIVIAGAGAIGGYIGARLARAGADVVLYARGPHLHAMQDRGLRIVSPDGDFEVKPEVAGDLNAIDRADVIVLGVKAHSLPALAPQLRPLLGPDTVVVSTQNGIPWWYFQNHGGELEGLRLERVDPGGTIAAAIEPRRVVGSLAYFSTDIVEPG